ncbi:flagellar motor switch protein FliN [Desulfocucumis palustris]|uniref:Flagellar motor switch protein FliN n=1 Tax=Desulfocucumis palustris TaxID=1898651 RepID=A0A2L2XAJ3_9FIRM|nr:flagellar motor switch phosphatase FliY [Desulfocucumis palustris]GBF33215.1 flagellar motor switch protein FliN [Desulfocucumis palustris]
MGDNSGMLSQAEIDALLNGTAGEPEVAPEAPAVEAGQEAPAETAPVTVAVDGEYLTHEEKDSLGEIGNITMGSASTTLSELLRQKVTITSPKVNILTQEQMFNTFSVPYVFIQVEYVSGLQGFNVLVLRLRDASVIADLMMGGDGSNPSEDEIGEIEISAASEAMNQMIGTASTSLSNMFGRMINISPPTTNLLKSQEVMTYRLPAGDPVVVISFNMQIGNLLDTEIMQVLSIETAKEEAALLWEYLMGMSAGEASLPEPEPAGSFDDNYTDMAEEAPITEQTPLATAESVIQGFMGAEAPQPRQTAGSQGQVSETRAPGAKGQTTGGQTYGVPPVSQPVTYSFPSLTQVEQRKLELLLDVPLRVSVILGRTKRPIKEVLNLTPGAIVELQSLVDEPVEILVNGTLVARGEVVVVNENFGVRITSIISPEERIKQLKA